MSLHGFEQDFTKDLESFVKKEAEWIFPLTTWAPRKVAAPERHRMLGVAAGVSVQTQIHLLDTQNPAFEMMESMLRLYMNPVEYSLLVGQKGEEIDLEKEQVWLFAIRWLTHYYECLTEPLVIRTDFYKQSHTKFLSLMRSMLQYSPGRRISFLDALASWNPTTEHPPKGVSPPEDPRRGSKTEELPGSDSQQSQTHVVEPIHKEGLEVRAQECLTKTVAVPVEESPNAHHTRLQQSAVALISDTSSVPVVSSAPSLPQPPQLVARSGTDGVRSRLVLKRSCDHAERNKTRRSLRNSNRSPANGNSAKQT